MWLLVRNANMTIIIVTTITCDNIVINVFKTNIFWLCCINSSIVITVGDIVGWLVKHINIIISISMKWSPADSIVAVLYT